MKLRNLGAAAAILVAAAPLVRCGSASSPTGAPTPGGGISLPTPAATPTPAEGLPAGLVCDPTPPPLLRVEVKVHASNGERSVLDSKPVVQNVDHYCDKVGFGNWKFCDTRQEGDPQRTACDYLVMGKAEDTGRWGPTWYYVSDLCSVFPESCANHPDNQFLVIAKGKGIYEACASDDWPLASNGGRCGTIELK